MLRRGRRGKDDEEEDVEKSKGKKERRGRRGKDDEKEDVEKRKEV